MEVDNFAIIKKELSFANKDEFYFLQILQRNKDGHKDVNGRNKNRLIKSYYIHSVEELEKHKEKIKELCVNNGARAYINLNVRNFKEVCLGCISKYSELVLNEESLHGYNVWDKVCGINRAKGYKMLWLIDVDKSEDLEEIKNIIEDCKGGEEKIKCIISTVHGYHIMSYGFSREEFYQKIKEKGMGYIDIHKDNPTLLYYNG